MQPFHYRNLGSMATVGRNRAVAEFSSFKTAGWLAWVMWLVVHLRSILGVRNKANVLLNWIWNYFTYDQSLRMIVYAKKAKEVRDREELEAKTHWVKRTIHSHKGLSLRSGIREIKPTDFAMTFNPLQSTRSTQRLKTLCTPCTCGELYSYLFRQVTHIVMTVLVFPL